MRCVCERTGGSFLLASRAFPELPYLQIPFSNEEIRISARPAALSNYNYWHHKARHVAEKTIQRWLYRCPKCRSGLPFFSSRNCIIFVISSLVLHQMCQVMEDEWMDDDASIPCVIVASKDGEDVPGVEEEGHRVYDVNPEGVGGELDYYDLKSMVIPERHNEAGEVVSEEAMNSMYEKLKIVARKRRDFLVELVALFPNRSVSMFDD